MDVFERPCETALSEAGTVAQRGGSGRPVDDRNAAGSRGAHGTEARCHSDMGSARLCGTGEAEPAVLLSHAVDPMRSIGRGTVTRAMSVAACAEVAVATGGKPPSVPRTRRGTIGLTAKELFDRLSCASALVALCPLLLMIALAVKASSRGPVLFTQRRRGRLGCVFIIYKFRTMHVHSRDDGALIQATRHDARVTGLGRWLRRTSLDELPQLFNVLKGEMSVVGPRPHAVEHDDFYEPLIPGYSERQSVKPGITGWAQIHGLRGETEHVEKMAARVEFDLYYVRHWSILLDMQIIARTVLGGLAARNAY